MVVAITMLIMTAAILHHHLGGIPCHRLGRLLVPVLMIVMMTIGGQ